MVERKHGLSGLMGGMAVLGLISVGAVQAHAHAQPSLLETVQDEGVVRCGVQEIGPAFSNINTDGRWVGFYADLCRSLAAAVLDDPEAVEFVIIGTDDRFSGLRDGSFDVLMSSATWTLGRDAHDLTFLPMYLFDGQGFLYHKASGVTSLADLKDGTICIEEHTTSLGNAQDYSDAENLNWTIKTYATVEGAFNAFFGQQCDSVTTDILSLASSWRFLSPNPEDQAILPTPISKEPLSAVVKSGDDKWADAVRWVINAVIAAEELGITSNNIDQMKVSNSAEVRRLLGVEGDMGVQLGLSNDFAVRALKASGNYGEIFERNLTKELGMDRGINNLWTNGGLIWAPPVR